MGEEDADITRAPIATRAIAGAAWSMGLLALLLPLRVAGAAVLSRTGLQIYGFWAYLTLLVDLIPSLFLFGGTRVLVYFLPKCVPGAKRRFVVSFALVALAGTLFGLAVVLWVPALRGLLGIEEHFRLVAAFLAAAVPVQVANLVLSGALQGEMRLADAEKAKSVPQAVAVVVLIGVFLARPGFASGHHVTLLMAVMGLSMVTTLGWSLALFLRAFPKGPDVPPSQRFPRGMWRYAGYLHLNQLVDFIYMRADHWIVFYFFGLEVLAGYAVARRLAQFVGVIPLTLRGIVFSTFCQLQSPDERDRGRRVFRLSVLVNNCFSFPTALLLVCFGHELVALISREYPAVAGRIVILVAAAGAVGGLGGVNASYIMGRGRSHFTFLVAALGGACQLLLTWLFVATGRGEFGVALARSTAIILMLFPTTWYVLRMLPRAIPAGYLVGVACVVGISSAVAWGDPGAAWRTGLFLAGAAAVIVTSIRQMEPAIRRLVLAPWRLVRLLAAEQRMTTTGESQAGAAQAGPSREMTDGECPCE